MRQSNSLCEWKFLLKTSIKFIFSEFSEIGFIFSYISTPVYLCHLLSLESRRAKLSDDISILFGNQQKLFV